MTRRGILAYGSYLPAHRLDRSAIAVVAGKGGGKGTRTVASYDEDTTTMAVEAGRAVLGCLGPEYEALQQETRLALWFATTTPAYADKTNATAIHAALELDAAVPAYDVVGAVRSTMGTLRSGLDAAAGGRHALLLSADVRTGQPGSTDEAAGGDAAAGLLVGAPTEATPLLAEAIGWGSATAEFLDRWRAPGDAASRVWEERFGEGRYLELGQRAWDDALKDAGLTADQVDQLVVASSHTRAATAFARRTSPVEAGSGGSELDLARTVGFTGAAHPFLALAAALDRAEPGRVVALVVLADGADVVLFRTTEALAAGGPTRSVADQAAAGRPVTYGRYLAWRGWLPVAPPNRPEPARPSASAAGRSAQWKFAFVASESEDGTVHMPPSLQDGGRRRRMADALGTIATFTVDRMAYSPSPPVVFAVVDFDGGGRLPVELTDVDPEAVGIGDRVAMTFRRLYTADGIHNYFWKARRLPRADRTAGEEQD